MPRWNPTWALNHLNMKYCVKHQISNLTLNIVDFFVWEQKWKWHRKIHSDTPKSSPSVCSWNQHCMYALPSNCNKRRDQILGIYHQFRGGNVFKSSSTTMGITFPFKRSYLYTVDTVSPRSTSGAKAIPSQIPGGNLASSSTTTPYTSSLEPKTMFYYQCMFTDSKVKMHRITKVWLILCYCKNHQVVTE
jgi:hypothetical protein